MLNSFSALQGQRLGKVPSVQGCSAWGWSSSCYYGEPIQRCGNIQDKDTLLLSFPAVTGKSIESDIFSVRDLRPLFHNLTKGLHKRMQAQITPSVPGNTAYTVWKPLWAAGKPFWLWIQAKWECLRSCAALAKPYFPRIQSILFSGSLPATKTFGNIDNQGFYLMANNCLTSHRPSEDCWVNCFGNVQVTHNNRRGTNISQWAACQIQPSHSFPQMALTMKLCFSCILAFVCWFNQWKYLVISFPVTW